MSQLTLNADRAFFATQRIVTFSICAILAYFVISFIWPPDRPKTVANLIVQFEGRACYWNRFEEKPGVAERLFDRYFSVVSKITAAKMLGEMGPEAKEAVPSLIDELVNGPNDIETGDGGFAYRSTIAIALGKIGDTRAIEPLTEKLKVKEKATFSSGYSGGLNPYEPTGIGHPAIVEALGMFGRKARSALPAIKALRHTNDHQLLNAIEITVDQIENGID